MAYTAPAFGFYQIGFEGDATPGTAVAATGILAVPEIKFKPLDNVVRPQIAQGIGIANPGEEYTSMRGMEFEIPPTEAFFEDLQRYFNMGIVELDSPTTSIWTHTRNPLVIPDIRTATIERRKSDGTSHQDEEWAYCFLSSFKFESSIDDAVRFSAKGFGRARASSTLTAAQALPTGLQALLGARSAVFLNDSWATLGNTELSAKVLGWSFEYMTGWEPVRTAKSGGTLDFVDHRQNPRQVDLKAELTISVDSTRTDELAKAEGNSLRAVQISIDGDSAARYLQLRFLCKYEIGSVYEFGEEDGRDIVVLKLRGATDKTNFFEAKVKNGIGALG